LKQPLSQRRNVVAGPGQWPSRRAGVQGV